MASTTLYMYCLCYCCKNVLRCPLSEVTPKTEILIKMSFVFVFLFFLKKFKFFLTWLNKGYWLIDYDINTIKSCCLIGWFPFANWCTHVYCNFISACACDVIKESIAASFAGWEGENKVMKGLDLICNTDPSRLALTPILRVTISTI